MLLGCRLAHPRHRGRSPLDRTIRKIIAWPNHANRNLAEKPAATPVRDGPMTLRVLDSCRYLGPATAVNIFSTFFLLSDVCFSG